MNNEEPLHLLFNYSLNLQVRVYVVQIKFLGEVMGKDISKFVKGLEDPHFRRVFPCIDFMI